MEYEENVGVVLNEMPMKREEKIQALKNKDLDLYLNTRSEVERELSDKQQLFCCCGKLATGLHERYCRKFQSKVDAETVARLEHLIIDKHPIKKFTATYHIHNGKKPSDFEEHSEIIEARSVNEAYQIALLRATTPGQVSTFPVTILKKDVR